MDVNVEVTIFDLSLKTSYAKYPWKVCSIALTALTSSDTIFIPPSLFIFHIVN